MRTIYRLSDGSPVSCEKQQLKEMLKNPNFSETKPEESFSIADAPQESITDIRKEAEQKQQAKRGRPRAAKK